MDTDTRIAVLIDADNTSPKYAEALLEELAKYGTPTIKRAYGDWSSQRLNGWSKELNVRAIRAMQQHAYTVGKNSTDSALIIDAMDLLYDGNVEAFALVSSDSDFTGLALRLRESGKVVYGIGRTRTPLSLQNACDRFIQLENLGEDADEEDAEAPEAEDAPKLNLQSVLTKAVNATADDDGWTTVGRLGNHLSRTHANFDTRTFGHAKLSTLVTAQKFLESSGDGNQVNVRLKGHQPAKKAPAKKTAAAAAAAKAETQPAAAARTTVTTRTRKAAKKAPSTPQD